MDQVGIDWLWLSFHLESLSLLLRNYSRERVVYNAQVWEIDNDIIQKSDQARKVWPANSIFHLGYANIFWVWHYQQGFKSLDK